MTNVVEIPMVEPEEPVDNSGKRALWMLASATGIVFCGGAIVGALGAHAEDGGGPLDTAMIVIVSVFALGALACLGALLRQGMKLKAEGVGLTPRERMSQNILYGSLAAGGLIGLLLITQSGSVMDPFSEGPVSPVFAIVLALAWGVAMPVMSYVWHRRAIDEQEADAYRTGAMFAAYAYWIGAPVWWILWRGGFLPAPNGMAIYFVTIFTALFIWFWKKYR